VRIRIALTTAIAVSSMTTAFLISLGHPPAAASNAARVTASARHAVATSNAGIAAPAVPVVVHTASEWVIEDGAGHFPATALPGTAPVTPPAPVPVPLNDDNSVATADWQCIRVHESGDNYNDPNMPSGAYGILVSTWESFGYSGWPYQAAPAVQDAVALHLHAEYGFEPWSSRFACGL
jgi:hypothetical protein